MLELNKIYNEDCLEGMKKIPDKSIDLILTDPPYGVNFTYDKYNDTPENLKILVDKFMPEFLRIAKVVLITCGINNIYIYPKPNWILAWVIPAGAYMNTWGFTCWQPILAYGKNPYLANRLGSRPDIIISNERSEKNIHSCPKPLNVWCDILKKGSINENDIVLDPFMGSGTTAIACLRLKRNYIGFEISKEYCDLAEKRIKENKRIIRRSVL